MRKTFAALIALAAPTVEADASFRYVLGGADCAPEVGVLHVSGSRLRLEGANGIAIYDGLEQMLVGLDASNRTFMQIEVDDDAQDFQRDVASASMTRVDRELERANAMLAQQRAEADARCRKDRSQCAAASMLQGIDLDAMMNMDVGALAAQQEQMIGQLDEKTLRQAGIDPAQMRAQLDDAKTQAAKARSKEERGPVEVVDTGRSETHDRIACRVRELRAGDALVESRCEAGFDALGLDERDRRGVERGYKRLTSYAESFQPIVDRFGVAAGAPRPEGLVVRQVCYGDDGRERGRATLAIAREPLAEALFEIPADYRPMMGAGAPEPEG